VDLEIFEMRDDEPDQGAPWRTGYAFTAPGVAVSCAHVEETYEDGLVRVTQPGEPGGPGPWTATGPDSVTALLALIAQRWGFDASFHLKEER